MPNKRGHNEGSIRKRKDGTWEARYSIGVDISGKQVQRSVYGKTRSEVSVKLTQMLEKINTGKYIDQSQMSLSNFLDEWLLTKRNTLKSTTYDSYEQHIRVHIKPLIGRIKMKDLSRKYIQELYDLKFEKGKVDNSGGLSSASIVKIHTVLHSALEYAVKNRMIANNPCYDASIPRGTPKERRVLTIEEQRAFLMVLEGDRLKVAFILSISTGMRLGEILALTWNNINFDEKYLIVRKTLVNIKNRSTTSSKYTLTPQEPKTERAKRLIPIPDTLIPLLKEQREQELKEKSLVAKYIKITILCFQLR